MFSRNIIVMPAAPPAPPPTRREMPPAPPTRREPPPAPKPKTPSTPTEPCPNRGPNRIPGPCTNPP